MLPSMRAILNEALGVQLQADENNRGMWGCYDLASGMVRLVSVVRFQCCFPFSPESTLRQSTLLPSFFQTRLVFFFL